ncbi:site-specific integrase [uncultured Duncaniella sp.]|uniref:site-specific integrase n=1 Tax=uncultured Duncaniella sp. TaxID=2768039 RepID=UPI00273130BC|nr:site-specific integrase [uncultured Duncaniella sp.]
MAAASIKEPVRIRRKALANGNVSLYLAIYINGHREYEFLKLYLIPEKTKADKERNKQTMALANSIKAQRIVDIQNGAHGFKGDFKEQTLFYEYYNALTEKRKKKESKGNFSNWASCLRHLMKYDPRKNLTFADITPKWVEGFRDYLENKAEAFGCDRRERQNKKPLSQNSRQSYFNKLRACLRQAYEDGIIRVNPMRGIQGFASQEGTRDYLTLEEVKAMAAVDCDFPEIKRTFLFSCLTGLRRSDIIKLTWGEVTELNGRTRLIFRQKKTGGQEYLDITPQAAELIGARGKAKSTDKVFGDIRYPGETNDSLRIWALRAGIDKNVTFHVGRHTFAVLMLTLGTDIYTVSKLLGHRELKTTQIYAKIVDAKKQEAVDNIPKIF